MSVASQLREYILEHILKSQEPASFDDDFNLVENGALDSLHMVNLITYLESEFNIELDDYDINPENFESLNALLAFMQRKGIET